MVNPGSFAGSRKAFLISLKEYYATAVNEGNAAEGLSTIQRRYLLRYPIDLPHDQEPSEEELASVDDDAAVVDPEGPNPDVMTLEEYEAALAKWEDRQKLLLFRLAQIKRWFSYQYMKDTDLDSTQTGLFNPYRPLLSKLTGKKINAPRQLSAANTWRKTQRDAIEAEFKRRVQASKDESNVEEIKKEKFLALRDAITREMFQALSAEEQRGWLQTAIADNQEQTRKWKKEMQAKPATDPMSRQVAIQGLVKFIQPILDLVCDATGWKASFICGGPEPAQNGLLNVISVHSGVTSGDVKMSFGRAERAQFRKHVVPLYGSFLQKCFTPVECRARALRPEQGFVPLAGLDLENEGASVDLVGSSTQAPPIRLGSTPAPPSKAPAAVSTNHQTSTSAGTPIAISSTLSQNPPAIPAETQPLPTSTASTAPTISPTMATAHHVSTPSMDIASRPPSTDVTKSAVSQDLNPTTPATPHSVPKLGPVGGGEIREKSVEPSAGEEQVGINNPFPFEIPTGSSRPATPSPTAPMEGIPESRNPTPLPSPCGSPGQASQEFLVGSKADNPSTITNPQPSQIKEPAPPIMEAAPSDSCKTVSTARSKRARGAAQLVEEKDTSAHGNNKRPIEDSQGNSGPSPSSPVAKRLRTSRSIPTQSPSGFEVPQDAPSWFKKSLAMLSSRDFGKEWEDVIGCWSQFEATATYKGDLYLGNAHRPMAIKDWIQRARSAAWRPQIRDPVAFGSQLRKWWIGVQPDWRLLEGGELSKVSEGNWEGMQRPGVNGLLSVAACLFFWADSLKDFKKDNGQWLEVVNDFQLVLTQLNKVVL